MSVGWAEEFRLSLGRNIRRYRKAAELSQEEFAISWQRVLGELRASPQSIQARMEHGDRPVSVDELAAMSMVLEVEPTMLIPIVVFGRDG